MDRQTVRETEKQMDRTDKIVIFILGLMNIFRACMCMYVCVCLYVCMSVYARACVRVCTRACICLSLSLSRSLNSSGVNIVLMSWYLWDC